MKQMERLSGRFNRRQIFRDFLYLTAYQISNRTDLVHLEKRLKLAREVWKNYSSQEIALFSNILELFLDGISQNSDMGQLEAVFISV